MVEYPYCKFNEAVTTCSCNEACLLVTLGLGSKHITIEGQIDSGCTITHINAQVAEVLGIDLQTCTEVETIGIAGSAIGYLSALQFHIDGHGEPFEGPVLFVPDLPNDMLLGQMNFFDKFIITFNKSAYVFSLERVN